MTKPLTDDQIVALLTRDGSREDMLREALREIVRTDDLPGMCVPEWEAAIDRARALLGEGT